MYVYCVQREAEVALRQARKEEKKKEREERLKKLNEQKPNDTDEQLQEEEEDELPPLYIPFPPSPLHCGFYSAPGSFWLSMVQIHTPPDKI